MSTIQKTLVSESATSAAFAAYQWVRKMKDQGKERGEIPNTLIEKFGERYPDVGIFVKPSYG